MGGMPHPVDISASDAGGGIRTQNTDAISISARVGWFASTTFLRYGRKALETVLGEHINKALGDIHALRE